MTTLQRVTIGIVIMALAGLCASGFQGQKPPDDYRRCQEIQPLDEPFSGFDSLNVRFIGNWPFGASYAVAYDASRSLVFCGSGGGVYILDVSNPSSPAKISESIHTRGVVRGLFYDSDLQRLYIADGNAGLEIWDVSNPSSPYKLGYYFTPGDAYGVYVLGFYAYVANHWAGLHIINVSNPASPIQVGYYNTPGGAFGVYVSGAYAYVADYGAGLQIYQYYGPGITEEASERLSRIRLLKNPLQNNIELLFNLPADNGMNLNLYNLLGQEIRTYQINKGISGRISLPTDGLSAGIYFLKSEGYEGGLIKVVVVK